MTFDIVKQRLKFDLIFSNNIIEKSFVGSLPSPFIFQSDPEMYFDIDFRTRSTPQYDELFLDHNHHFIRLLDLIVFKGNRLIITEPTSSSEPHILEAQLLDGGLILLSDSQLPGPYKRISTDPSISDYRERIKLENLIFDFQTPVNYNQSAIPNCLHSIDAGYCLFCETGFIPANNHQECSACSQGEFFDPASNLCLPNSLTLEGKIVQFDLKQVPFNWIPISYSFKNIQPAVEFYSIYGVSCVSFVPPLEAPISANDLKTFTFQTLEKNKIYIIKMKLSIYYTVKEFIFNPFLNLNINTKYADGTESSKFFQYEYDMIDFDESNKMVYYYFFVTISTFKKNWTQANINFFINNNKFAQIPPNLTFFNYILIYSISLQNYLEIIYLRGKNGSNRIEHSCSYMNKNDEDTFFYFPKDLISYESLYDFDYFEEEYFINRELSFPFLQTCQWACKVCKSERECIQCKDGFFLSDGSCSKCFSSCITCKDHPSMCLQCSDGTYPISKKKSNKLI